MKKNIIISLILILAGVLAACTAIYGQTAPDSGSTEGQPPSGAPAGGPIGMPGKSPAGGSSTAQAQTLPVESVVGIGIIKLEGTDNAIDAETAADLLPLFKALKALSNNSNTSVAEIKALNTQIKNTLKANQLAAIENLKITSADVTKLLQENGLTSSSSLSSGSSSSSSRNNGGFGGPPDGGMMMMAAGNTMSSKTQSTPNAVAALTSSRKSAGGYNLTFADIIIKLLETKGKK
ncbi:MAG: hypothetical protein GYA12_15630 [Chloroflexi bacterium]|jgi:hypothetical protein|nr:hypothetical protein [Chloroflexota bacterium]BCY18538.1 hypothetical protein hrd7_23870 [Leptolinea sp. HRD-7]